MAYILDFIYCHKYMLCKLPYVILVEERVNVIKPVMYITLTVLLQCSQKHLDISEVLIHHPVLFSQVLEVLGG